MTIAIAVAWVMAAVQFVKKVFPALAGAAAIVAVVVGSAGITLYKYVGEGLAIDLSAVIFFVQVVIGAIGAYSLIKVASGSK